jgi:DNA-binding GntR family transcriptional regulator
MAAPKTAEPPMLEAASAPRGSEHQFARITATPAYRLVADAIEREILSGRLRPGEPIGTEAQLVQQFGVNRSSTRRSMR